MRREGASAAIDCAARRSVRAGGRAATLFEVKPPFFTQHARNRAEDVLSALSVAGAAMLVFRSGAVGATSGAVEVDFAEIAKLVVDRGGADRLVSFSRGGACIYATPLERGWILCAISTFAADPGAMIERLAWGAKAIAYSFTDRPKSAPPSSGGGDEGAPAEVFARPIHERVR